VLDPFTWRPLAYAATTGGFTFEGTRPDLSSIYGKSAKPPLAMKFEYVIPLPVPPIGAQTRPRSRLGAEE